VCEQDALSKRNALQDTGKMVQTVIKRKVGYASAKGKNSADAMDIEK
jgi:hypothetical protein